MLEIILIPEVEVSEIEFFHLRFLLKSLFRLFLSFFKDFYIAKKVYRFKLLGFWLRFFNFRIFHDSILSLYFYHGNISKANALLGLVSQLSNIVSRLKTYFGLIFNRFFLIISFQISSSQLFCYISAFIKGLKPFWKN